MPGSLEDLLNHWNYGFNQVLQGKGCLEIDVCGCLWNIWLERNRRFLKVNRDVSTRLSMSFFQVSTWAAKCKKFKGYSSADILRGWLALFADGRQKLSHVSLWVPLPRPLQGLLKLNFDGSYIRELHRGGIGSYPELSRYYFAYSFGSSFLFLC